ncbi:MAG: hypothetical protein H2184_07485 [Candidatus Galacturonibacter soehngenii]|nr:hypothetical protein [Candidatus Galacturonibacter soehngenii]
MKKIFKKIIMLALALVLILSTNTTPIKAADKTKLLVYNSNISTSYDLEIDITATYSKNKWTGVADISPSIDSNQLLVQYTIAENNLECTYDAKTIKLSGSLTINEYYGAGIARVKVGSFEYTIDKSFRASDYLN